MKYIISTLGCKVNQYETQAMETMLLEHGHEPAAPGEIADAVIVNTCAVTAESGRKSRQLIRRLRDENPGAVLAVCGEAVMESDKRSAQKRKTTYAWEHIAGNSGEGSEGVDALLDKWGIDTGK